MTFTKLAFGGLTVNDGGARIVLDDLSDVLDSLLHCFLARRIGGIVCPRGHVM